MGTDYTPYTPDGMSWCLDMVVETDAEVDEASLVPSLSESPDHKSLSKDLVVHDLYLRETLGVNGPGGRDLGNVVWNGPTVNTRFKAVFPEYGYMNPDEAPGAYFRSLNEAAKYLFEVNTGVRKP